MRAIPQDAARPVQQVERCERIAVAVKPLRRWRHGQGSQNHLSQQAERAQRSHQQAGQVVARDVLHRRTAGGDDFAGGVDVASLQHEIAHVPVAEPAVSAEPARQQSTDRRRIVGRVERDHLAGLRQVRAQLADGCGRAAPHRHLGGFVFPHAGGRPHLTRAACRFAAHLPMRARAHHRDRSAGADLASKCRHLRSDVRSQAAVGI